MSTQCARPWAKSRLITSLKELAVVKVALYKGQKIDAEVLFRLPPTSACPMC